MIIKSLEYNVETGEQTITEREETAAEIKAREKLEAEAKAKIESTATVKAALLAKLGITAEEAVLLLS